MKINNQTAAGFNVGGETFDTLAMAESYAKTASKMFADKSFEVRNGARFLMQYTQGRKHRTASPIIPIADLYADLLAAVNRGDLDGAKQLAARIAA